MKYFLSGILFYTVGLPFVEGLVAAMNQTFQLICGKIALKTVKVNAELKKYDDDSSDEEEHKHPFGFSLPEPTIVGEEEDG